jgi:dienelactone hydrolase
MADNDIATRAPESDAQEKPQEQPDVPKPAEESVFPGDTRAQQGPSMGEHCTTDRPTPSGEKPTGDLTKLGGVECYIAKPADYPHSPSKLLLMLTGGTGVKSTNNQLQADKYASEGYLVVMPDQFDNDPAPNTVDMTEIPKEASWLESVKLRTAEGFKSFMIDMWLARHTPEKVLPLLHKVVESAREEYADAVANGGGMYGVGYCFGAKYILMLASELPDTVAWGQEAQKDVEQGTVKKEPVLKAGAVAHPTMTYKEDLEAVKSPIYIAAVKDDPMFSEDEALTPGRRAMENNKVEHEIQLFSDVPHGFAVYGDYADSKIKQSQAQAFGQMLGWIQSH